MRARFYIPSEYFEEKDVHKTKTKDTHEKNECKYPTFSMRFQSLVAKESYTTEELRKILSISRTTLWKFMQGYKLPSTECLLRISKHFGVTPNYLLGISNVSDSYIGLSQESIDNMHEWTENPIYRDLNNVYDYILSSDKSKPFHSNITHLYSDMREYANYRDNAPTTTIGQVSFIEYSGEILYGSLHREEQLRQSREKLKMQIFMVTKEFCKMLEDIVHSELKEDIFLSPDSRVEDKEDEDDED